MPLLMHFATQQSSSAITSMRFIGKTRYLKWHSRKIVPREHYLQYYGVIQLPKSQSLHSIEHARHSTELVLKINRSLELEFQITLNGFGPVE